ncbi:hypothetical protein [Hansschlegelia beijingensis]|uniref:Uncharacterized protein n=1 Tax=Hansschlegelia beijingensis TaxID=1133344 RepID=A0A7W6D431_9HYPH|nr:hypothetical protein [Hansschlegelia beijingensis]MBB3971789.1 hypothetical protein [Hansschlegelia beijingensis]
MNIEGVESRARARFLSCALAQDDEIGSRAREFAGELSRELLCSLAHERALLLFRLEALLKSLEAYDPMFPVKLANPVNARCRRFLAGVIDELRRGAAASAMPRARRSKAGRLALAM